MSSLLLKVSGLSKDYGHTPVFKDVSLSINPGETVGLYGKSGSGKSTLGRCITRLEEPSSGIIEFKGKRFDNISQKNLRILRPGIQMIFQHPESSLNPRMRVIDSITEPVRFLKKMTRDDAIKHLSPLLSKVGIREDQLMRYPHQLSGGEIQRAVIAKVFSLEPEFIIADEATSMLDVSVQAQVIHLMKTLQSQTHVAYLMISHDLDLLEKVCQRILRMQGGTIGEGDR